MAKIISNHGAFPTCDAGATAVAADLGSPSSAPRSAEIEQFESTGLAKLSGLWETGGMKKPELTDLGWLGPRDEMDRASHRFGKCSECHEIICVEKVVTDTQNTQPETNETLYRAFRTHVTLKHGPNALHADVA